MMHRRWARGHHGSSWGADDGVAEGGAVAAGLGVPQMGSFPWFGEGAHQAVVQRSLRWDPTTRGA
jgi:hypothetical protein